jgi:hypothetical protein
MLEQKLPAWRTLDVTVLCRDYLKNLSADWGALTL